MSQAVSDPPGTLETIWLTPTRQGYECLACLSESPAPYPHRVPCACACGAVLTCCDSCRQSGDLERAGHQGRLCITCRNDLH